MTRRNESTGNGEIRDATRTPSPGLPRERSGLSRRALIVSGVAIVGAGAAGALAIGAGDRPVAVDAAATPSATPTPTPASGPTRTIPEVRADAAASAGRQFAGSPWQASPVGDVGAWASAFALWLLRGNVDATAVAPQALHDRFAAAAMTGSEAREGALIFYTAGTPDSVYHVGFVDAVGAAGTHTVEGDVPGGLPPDRTFVRLYGQPWDSDVVYAYPAYRAPS